MDVVFSGLALQAAPLLAVGLCFQSLTQSTGLATLLPISVVSPDVSSLFGAAENEEKNHHGHYSRR